LNGVFISSVTSNVKCREENRTKQCQVEAQSRLYCRRRSVKRDDVWKVFTKVTVDFTPASKKSSTRLWKDAIIAPFPFL
jgi:hypothetical protein